MLQFLRITWHFLRGHSINKSNLVTVIPYVSILYQKPAACSEDLRHQHPLSSVTCSFLWYVHLLCALSIRSTIAEDIARVLYATSAVSLAFVCECDIDASYA
jgi:hypothetical protein